jgi:hypothetical protein
MEKPAETQVPIHDLLRRRWSPRAYDQWPIEIEKLRSLFEAARWAPSSNNEQPWRFLGGSPAAMPAWGIRPEDDVDSWKLVHFIRHLPHLTPDELEKMRALNPKSLKELKEETEFEPSCRAMSLKQPRPHITNHGGLFYATFDRIGSVPGHDDRHPGIRA